MKSLTCLIVAFVGLACITSCTEDPDPAGADAADSWTIDRDARRDDTVDASDAPPDLHDTRGSDVSDVVDTPDSTTDDAETDAREDACLPGNDCDSDGLADCEEQMLGTEVCEADTDGDGLTDFEELETRTDPLSADTDGDGLEDGEEVRLQLNPRTEVTFDDGIIDSNRWFVTACDNPRGESVNYVENRRANWKLALPPAFQSTNLTIAGATHQNFYAADVYVDPAYPTAGATISAAPSTAISTPRAKLDQIRDTLDHLTSQSDLTVTRAAFPADRDDPTATSQFIVEVGTPMATSALRNDLLFEIAPFSRQDVTGLPAPGSDTHTRFRVTASVLARDFADGTSQMVTRLAVINEPRYVSTRHIREQVRRLNDGSNLGRVIREPKTECHVEPPLPTPKVDVYWIIDPSASMHDDIRELRSAAGALFDGLAGARVDVRVGVTTTDESRSGRLLAPKWHTTAAGFESALDKILTGTPPTGDDDGYIAATRGLDYMTGPSAPADEVIRRDARVFTVFFGDEEAQTFQDTRLDSNFQQLETYATEIKRYGDIYSITSKDAVSYRFAALLHHGAYAPLGDTPLTEQLYELVEEFAGASSPYTLPERPISTSLRVFKNDNWAPPGRPDGYTYDPATHTIAFHGRWRPSAGADDVEQGYTVMIYDYFGSRTAN